jgi:hypothetical protein
MTKWCLKCGRDGHTSSSCPRNFIFVHSHDDIRSNYSQSSFRTISSQIRANSSRVSSIVLSHPVRSGQ